MSKHPIGTVINFCTNESRFIRPCLEQALLFSHQVVVVTASHFFDGTSENRTLLEEIYAAFPECLFVEYPFLPTQIPRQALQTVRPEAFWHCLSRLIGVSMLDDKIEAVLFLDADEIADGVRMLEWLDCSDYEYHTALKLANYWYFREPVYRAEHFEDSIVLAHRKSLNADLLLHDHERDAIYESLPGPKRRMVMGTDGLPLLHHFSWVRSKEEMLRKVRSWSHRKDRNWEELVEKEFQASFGGTDFVHGYRFQTVAAPFNTTSLSFQPKGKKNIRRLAPKEVKEYAKMKRSAFQNFFSRFMP